MGRVKKIWDILTGKDKKTGSLTTFTDNCNGLDEAYLFDFKNYSSGYSGVGNVSGNFTLTEGNDGHVTVTSVDGEKKEKIAVKPKHVLAELETVPNPFSLSNLDEKLKILKDKKKLIVQHYAKREVSALIDRLVNRKKYLENREFFDNFQNTTDEKIDILLDKYDLVMKTSDIFIPEFPDDAIEIMNSYNEKMEELFEKKPVYYVIAEPDKFKKAYEKRPNSIGSISIWFLLANTWCLG